MRGTDGGREESTDTTPPTSTITSPAPGETLRRRQPGDDHGHRDRRGRRRGRGRRSLDRRRLDLASGDADHAGRTVRQLVLLVGRARQPHDHDQVARRRRQRQPGDAVRRRHRQRLLPVLDLGQRDVTPPVADSGDPRSIEVGVKFTTDTSSARSRDPLLQGRPPTPGRTSATCGPPAASCWPAATFTSETASGWQQVNFSTPVEIFPNTTYVASYFAPAGHYAASRYYFYTPPATGGNAPQQPAAACRPRDRQLGERRLRLQRVEHLPHQHLQRLQLLGRSGVRARSGARPGDRRERDRRARLGQP